MAVEVLVAFFGFSSGQSYVIDGGENEGDKLTFTIIAPVHDAIKVTERRRERLGCEETAALSSTAFSSAI